MKNIIILIIFNSILISCQMEKEKDLNAEIKPDFKEALVELLIDYPEARLNNENDIGKIGFCVEASPSGIIVGNYMGNQIIGKLEVFDRKTGNIQYSDSIVNGTSVGPIIAYHDNGKLAYTLNRIEKVDTIINSEYYKNYKPKLKGYLKFYDDIGEVTEEGTVYYDESIELDCFKGKDWKKNK